MSQSSTQESTVAAELKDDADKRRHTRFPAQVDEVTITFSAAVNNESRSGVSLVLEEGYAIAVGTQIEINYNGHPTPAVVRYYQTLTDGRCQLGLEWLE